MLVALGARQSESRIFLENRKLTLSLFRHAIRFGMDASTNCQPIAERLAESGWSWQHVRLDDRVGRSQHVAEAHNEDGETHAAVAESVGSAFVALEESITGVGK